MDIQNSLSIVWGSLRSCLSWLISFNEATSGFFFSVVLSCFGLVLVLRFLVFPLVNRFPVGGLADSFSSGDSGSAPANVSERVKEQQRYKSSGSGVTYHKAPPPSQNKVNYQTNPYKLRGH